MLFKNKISVQKLVQKMYIKRITDQVLHPTYTRILHWMKRDTQRRRHLHFPLTLLDIFFKFIAWHPEIRQLTVSCSCVQGPAAGAPPVPNS